MLLLHHKYQLNSVLFVEEGGKKTQVLLKKVEKLQQNHALGGWPSTFTMWDEGKANMKDVHRGHGKQYNNKCPAGLLGQ